MFRKRNSVQGHVVCTTFPKNHHFLVYNGTISKLRTQNWGKSANFMSKSELVKARITKHNLISKFKKQITFKQTDDL